MTPLAAHIQDALVFSWKLAFKNDIPGQDVRLLPPHDELFHLAAARAVDRDNKAMADLAFYSDQVGGK